MMNKRTIRVTGTGMLRLRPDTTRISLELQGLCPKYGEALGRSAEDTESLRRLLEALGFAREELKTLNFSVDAEYEGYQEEGAWRQRFKGYRYRHSMKLDFPSDNERLGRVLFALTEAPARPELRLSYTLRDPEAAKNRLLDRAVADAREKAAVLTAAGGVRLGEILYIDYSRGELELEVRPMNRLMAAKSCADAGSMDLNVEPDDIQISDTVTVVWEIL